MNWTAPVDHYCERTDPSFWAEPVNAVTNAAFLLAALVGFLNWRRAGGRDVPALLLILVIVAIGLGSFAFHTVATRGAVLADVIPIAVFIYGYLLLALRRFMGLGTALALALVAGFLVLNRAVDAMAPPDALNGSLGYLPPLVAMLIVGALLRLRAEGRAILLAAGVFAVSLVFRTGDNAWCEAFPLGTHFIWHTLNAVVLYILLRAAITARAAPAA